MSEATTSTKIRKETGDELKSVGKKEQTYDDVINRLRGQVLKRKRG